ncbi:UDP-N-acetylglucosamine--N-acetylmuramyl-(pentapeptide) pyrophosphoryl-undecaprenol N-acetylglucosamine transferase [Deltaproteobacteria bacterium]|nr:UDP-N-acetylglucosamine--N-acetylmuramyl-(pentapeptide) pyrophosphoryl-undecaprenol N-acetylglucosamine transferase [Deltaproteobacteria bacterium]
MNRVIVTTGGTGGHIFPALAVAEAIKTHHHDASVLFMGGKYGPEGDLAAQAGLEFVGLPVRGFIGRGSGMLGAGFGMLRALAKAGIVMRRFKPEAVIGFGGYAAFAGVMAARHSGVKTAIHEQNSVPGVANRILARFADKVFVSLPDVRVCFPEKKTTFTGNPVRRSIAELAKSERNPVREGSKNILILGGSQGAKAINDCIIANLPALLDAGCNLWHQAGQADFARVCDSYRKGGGEKMRVAGFIQDMPSAYAWADIVICRAGATTIAELTCAGLPAIFIPFPAATHDHQTHNARQLTAVGAAELIPQPQLEAGKGNPAILVERVLAILADGEKRQVMRDGMCSLARPDAAMILVNNMEASLAQSAKKTA